MIILDTQLPYATATKAVEALAVTVQILLKDIPHELALPHSGRLYKKAAAKRAACLSALKKAASQEIFKASTAVTTACHSGWERDKQILSLWYQVANTVLYLSEHPSKKVATLIIDTEGKLQAFDANHVPDGIPKYGRHYIEGKRNQYIVCSERTALARLLNMQTDSRDIPYSNSTEKERGRRRDPILQPVDIKASILQQTKDLTDFGQNSEILRNSFILTTTSPCEICANVIAPFRPMGIIAMKGTDAEFRQGRQDSIIRAAELLERVTQMIYVPQPTWASPAVA